MGKGVAGVKIKGWFGASLVLLMAVSATLALFYYWENEKSATMQALQNRVNEIELERVVERGGQRLFKQTKKMAVEIENVITKIQISAEDLADNKVFRAAGNINNKKIIKNYENKFNL